jgi:hypothetical protein
MFSFPTGMKTSRCRSMPLLSKLLALYAGKKDALFALLPRPARSTVSKQETGTLLAGRGDA